MILCLISLYQATIRDPGSVDKTYVLYLSKEVVLLI